jgi:hypothetical protein
MANNQFNRTVYSIQGFLEVEIAIWGNLLKEHHIDCMQEEASYSQRKAWFDCFNILRKELILLPLSQQEKESMYLIFEYELPRERGRRPDVLLLSGDNLLVLEFKGYSEENHAQIDQVKHYARDLQSYHEQSHKLNVIPFLVLTAGHHTSHIADDVNVVSGDLLHTVLELYVKEPFRNIQSWFKSEYAPLPSLIQSAQLIFKEKQFPQIKRAHSAGIPNTLQMLNDLAEHARQTNTHHLALITGVPGAGKTLVGLQFVFETFTHANTQKAVFLSGNGPLVDVLQHSLNNKHFVQSVHGFLKQYAHSSQLPSEDVFIYDEAQRAWDAERVASSSREGSNAEPTDFINIGSKKEHCLLIGLIGEGQEIYLGEESGIQLWSEAIAQSNKQWKIHCPSKLVNSFPQADVVDAFNLTTSLRTHQALTLQSWVEQLLANNISTAKNLASQLYNEDYPIYLTRDLEKAKQHVKLKYQDELSKTYGLIASSKSKVLPKYGVLNDYNSTKSFKSAHYYVDESHPAYCRNLNTVVTEFSCQGLELDMPILAWEADWIYDAAWKDNSPLTKAKDSYKLRMNVYRVLLTRGRDGLVIFIPNEKVLDSTYAVLLKAGCKTL